MLHDKDLPFNLLKGFNTHTPYSLNIASRYSWYIDIILWLEVYQFYMTF